jgi:hypothetical protein
MICAAGISVNGAAFPTVDAQAEGNNSGRIEETEIVPLIACTSARAAESMVLLLIFARGLFLRMREQPVSSDYQPPGTNT